MSRHLRLSAAAQHRSLPQWEGGSIASELTAVRTSPRSVRISVTDRCDLACIYCRPSRRDGHFERRLDLQAWLVMAEGLLSVGIRRVRITGGEPLLYRHTVELVRGLARLPFEDVALTTNGTRLAVLAGPLRDAGLHRLNVSLDTLREDRFARMTRGGELAEVLRGLDAARQAGFDGVKLNTVVVRGQNEDEIADIVVWAWDRGLVPRFIELMPIGEGARIADRIVPYSEIRARIRHLIESDDPAREENRGPARYVSSRHDPARRVGFITGSSDTFCHGCDRLRVTSDGTLRPCLATNEGVATEDAARNGATQAIADKVREAWQQKPNGTTWKGCTESTAATVSMRQTGG